MKLDSLGRTVENREIWHVTLSTDLENSKSKPGIAFLGGHHSREHLSVEVPLLLIEKLVTAFRGGDAEVVRLLNGREIHVVPSVNPDGKEYDVATGDYRYWRKNRGKVNGTAYGIDLNRNYGYGWGGGGASSNPGSDVYRGPSAFSEPETQAVKKFVEAQSNLTTLLSFHTFSELILYPWGHQNSPIPNERDHAVHKTMAETMAKWNGYEPIQSSELYIASGDTTDWSYGELGIISFTFELDPKDMFSGGFYPGAGAIEAVSAKNWRPCLYLIEYADNPYRVLEPAHIKYGLNTPLVE
jgi:carboxypeptidase T